jgi:TetR/AcrR family transcriptional repressor of nem operon
MATTTRAPNDAAGGDDSRTRLVDAALRLIHAQSYNSVGVKAICDMARVRRGSFYHHFDSKQALVIAAIDEEWERFERDVLAWCDDESTSPQERLEAVLRVIHAGHRRDREETGHVLGCVFGNLAAESTALDGATRRRLDRVFAEWTDAFAAAISDGTFPAPTGEPSAHERATELLAAVQGLILLAKVQNDPDVISKGGRAAIARILGTSLAGAAPRPIDTR